MQRAVALAMLSLLAAGCAAPSPAAPPPHGPAAPESTIVRVGAGSTESSLAIGPDGTTWLACSHGNFQRASPLFLSLDAGLTWKDLPVPDAQLKSGDCDIAFSNDGKTWVAAYDTLASAAVAASHDSGKTWTVTNVASTTPGGVDRPWLGVVQGKFLMTWCDVMGAEPALCFASSSTDGVAWSSPPVVVTAPSPGKTLDVMGDMTISSDGKRVRIPVAWASGPEADPDVFFTMAASDDGGASWRDLTIAGPTKAPLAFTSASYASDGTLWTSYTSGAGGPTWLSGNVGGTFPVKADVLVRASRDDGKTWDAPRVIAPQQQFQPQASTWIAGGPAGQGLVGWMHDTGGNKWVVDTAIVPREPAGAPIAWRASGERAGTGAAGYDDYFVTAWSPTREPLALFVIGADVLLARGAAQP